MLTEIELIQQQLHDGCALSELTELIWKSERVIAHTMILARSLKHWTGHDLMPGWSDRIEMARAVYEAQFVIVSHGTEPDPILNYGNAAAQALWEMSWEELSRMPSRFTAEAPNREERARLLSRVSEHGFIDDYSGVRISKTGRRFLINRATVWNLLSDQGEPCGQAALFDEWRYL